MLHGDCAVHCIVYRGFCKIVVGSVVWSEGGMGWQAMYQAFISAYVCVRLGVIAVLLPLLLLREVGAGLSGIIHVL